MAVLMMATATYHGVPLRAILMEIMVHMGTVVLIVLLLLVGRGPIEFCSSLYIHINFLISEKVS